MVAIVQATNATRSDTTKRVGVVRLPWKALAQLSSVNRFQRVLNRPSGSLKLNTAIVISGMNR